MADMRNENMRCHIAIYQLHLNLFSIVANVNYVICSEYQFVNFQSSLKLLFCTLVTFKFVLHTYINNLLS